MGCGFVLLLAMVCGLVLLLAMGCGLVLLLAMGCGLVVVVSLTLPHSSLKGHTRGGRPEITAFRPAPIAVNYLVYAGTQASARVFSTVTTDFAVYNTSSSTPFSSFAVISGCAIH